MTITIPTVLGTPAAVSPGEAKAARFGAQAGAFEAVFLSGAATPRNGRTPEGAVVLSRVRTEGAIVPDASEAEAAEAEAVEATEALGKDLAEREGASPPVATGDPATDELPLPAQLAQLSDDAADRAAVAREIGSPNADDPAPIPPDEENMGGSQAIAAPPVAQPFAEAGGASDPRDAAPSTADSTVGYAVSPDWLSPVPVPEASDVPDLAGATILPPDARAQAPTPAETAIAVRSAQRFGFGISADASTAPVADRRAIPSGYSWPAGPSSEATGAPWPMQPDAPSLGKDDGVGFPIRPQGVGWAGPSVTAPGSAAGAPAHTASPGQTPQPLESKGVEEIRDHRFHEGEPHRPAGQPLAAVATGPNRQPQPATTPVEGGGTDHGTGTFGQLRKHLPFSAAEQRHGDRSAATAGTAPLAAGPHVVRMPVHTAPALMQPKAPGEGAGIGGAAPSGDPPMPSDIEISDIRGGSEAFGTDRSSSRQDAAIARGTETRLAVVQQITEVIRDPREGSIEVELHPRELGRVRMSFSMADGNLSVSVSADRPDTLDAIRRNIDQLSSELRTFGYRSLAFDFAGAGMGSEQGTWAGERDKEAERPIAADGTTEDAMPSRPAQPASTGLDLRL